MDTALDLISDITSFMNFFVPGYIALGCFHFVSCRPREDSIEYLLIKCISISYFITTFCVAIDSAVPSTDLHIFLIIISSIISGVFAGVIRRCKIIKKIIKRCFKREIFDDTFISLWEQVDDSDTEALLVRLTLKDDAYVYEGQLDRVTSLHRNPTLIITYYVIRDGEKVVDDFSRIDGMEMIVPYENISKFEVNYLTEGE